MLNVVYRCMNGLGKTETFHRKIKPLIRFVIFYRYMIEYITLHYKT